MQNLDPYSVAPKDMPEPFGNGYGYRSREAHNHYRCDVSVESRRDESVRSAVRYGGKVMHAPVGPRHGTREDIAPPAQSLRTVIDCHELRSSVVQPARIRVRVEHSVPLTRTGITTLLSRSSDFEVNPPNGPEDVLIADAAAGLRALRLRSARNVLIVAHEDGELLIRAALTMGVRGFLLHSCAVEELGAAVRTVSRGGTAFAPSVATRIAQSFTSEPLTERQLQVLRLMVLGFSDKDMARKLSIGHGTVKSHMKAILAKLGAARRTEAAAIAQRRGIARVF